MPSAARSGCGPATRSCWRTPGAASSTSVVAEALDRLSRDQEDVAGLYKHLSFAGVRLVTLAEGEISELHVGSRAR